jgi:thiosulfate dehydrogenase [quinone] large subunit
MTDTPPKHEGCCLSKDCCLHRGSAWAHALPRWGLAILFLVAAYNKLVHPENWAAYLPKFEPVLPALLLKPYFAVLPWVELLVGALLALGLFTRCALKLTGLVLLSLLLGTLLAKEFAVVAQNFVYLCATAALLATADHFGLGLDCLRKGCCAPGKKDSPAKGGCCS